MGKVVEIAVADLLAEEVDLSGKLHRGQFGSRRKRSAIDAVAIAIQSAQEAWAGRRIAGTLLMDVKEGFDHVSQTQLRSRINKLGINPNLTKWTSSFMSDSAVRMVVDEVECEENVVETGVP
jgi:hypothetical protein